LFNFDNEAREIIQEADRNGANIYGGFDRLTNSVIWTVEGYDKKTLSTNFNDAQFQILSDAIPSNTVHTIVTPPDHGTATIGLNGLLNYVPVTGYVGSDSIVYSSIVNGQTINRKICLTVVSNNGTQTAWKGKIGSESCVVTSGGQTGFVEYGILQEYYTNNGVLTGNEKNNVSSDPDYVQPYFDDVQCPVTSTFKWIIDNSASYCEQEITEYRDFVVAQYLRKLRITGESTTCGISSTITYRIQPYDIEGNPLPITGANSVNLNLPSGSSSAENSTSITSGPMDTIIIDNIVFFPAVCDSKINRVNGYLGSGGEEV